MRKNIKIEASDFSPMIELNNETGKIRIEGRSLPENTDEVFQPLVSWLKECGSEMNRETQIVFKLEYYNSASLRKFADILFLLKKIGNESKKNVSVLWYYEYGDETSWENAIDLKMSVDLPFELQKIEM